jgi:hypothetical protein
MEISGPTINPVFQDSADGKMYKIEGGVVVECGVYGAVEDGAIGEVAIYAAAGNAVTGLAIGIPGQLLMTYGPLSPPVWTDLHALFNPLYYNTAGLPQVFANNAAAIAGFLIAGQLYRTGGDPDHICIVH